MLRKVVQAGYSSPSSIPGEAMPFPAPGCDQTSIAVGEAVLRLQAS